MAIKVGINGFGRIGRMVFRAAAKDFPEIEVVAINDLLEPDYLAYMLKYDSVHGRFNGDVKVDGSNLVVNGKKIRLTAERDPANLKWSEVGADIVIECTGFFPDQGNLPGAHQGGREEGRAVGSFQGRHTDVRVRREPRNLQGREHRFRSLLHHQRPGTGGKGAARYIRHQARPDDHRACCDRHPEDR